MKIMKSVLFGILMAIVLIMISLIVEPIFGDSDKCNTWISKHSGIGTIFASGMLSFLIADIIGII